MSLGIVTVKFPLESVVVLATGELVGKPKLSISKKETPASRIGPLDAAPVITLPSSAGAVDTGVAVLPLFAGDTGSLPPPPPQDASVNRIRSAAIDHRGLLALFAANLFLISIPFFIPITRLLIG